MQFVQYDNLYYVFIMIIYTVISSACMCGGQTSGSTQLTFCD